MAKRKGAKKPPTKKAPPKKGAPAKRKPSGGTSKPAARERKSSPRSQALPGFEQVRNVRLDHYCEQLADVRSQMNTLRADEAGAMQGALKEMHAKGVTAYRHAGVEMARVPGEEKLRVRASKEQATTSVPSDAGDGGEGGGGDEPMFSDDPDTGGEE